MEDFQANNRPRLDAGAPVADEAEILRLVAQRESARQARNFQESDAIREELRNMGVDLFDKEKEWRSRDGRRGTLFTAGPSECPLSDMEIQDRIQQREEARRSKDFGRADSIRDELRSLGVEVNDKESLWRTSSGRGCTFSGAPLPAGGSFTPVDEIKRLINERERLRASQDFVNADEVRRQLSAMGVEVFDNEKRWRASDGTTGAIIAGGHEVSNCSLTDYEIITRVRQREDARAQKDFGTADSIRDELRRNGVDLVDKDKTWISTDGRSGHYSGGAAPAPMMNMQQAGGYGMQAGTGMNYGMTWTDASIAALVNGRERARARHDWQAADAIRNDLRSHGVEVFDREKMWRANDGRQGMIMSLA
eukprot:TRINITY_DN37718_c0_g1_i1.p1 TRINITY_DN37718_c0_g1~~TRINITY_DN37718_c0_g1_i1.p1  ORF type:complete len:365 (+),score=68.21 TRINITY_DN37718_c0_g1_i1:93-1187(+)